MKEATTIEVTTRTMIDIFAKIGAKYPKAERVSYKGIEMFGENLIFGVYLPKGKIVKQLVQIDITI